MDGGSFKRHSSVLLARNTVQWRKINFKHNEKRVIFSAQGLQGTRNWQQYEKNALSQKLGDGKKKERKSGQQEGTWIRERYYFRSYSTDFLLSTCSVLCTVSGQNGDQAENKAYRTPVCYLEQDKPAITDSSEQTVVFNGREFIFSCVMVQKSVADPREEGTPQLPELAQDVDQWSSFAFLHTWLPPSPRFFLPFSRDQERRGSRQ